MRRERDKTMKRIAIFLLLLLPAVTLWAAKAQRDTVVLTCDLHCQGCCDKVMKNIAFEKGVKDLLCDLKTKTVTVVYDKSKTTLENLLQAFEKIGKPAKVKTGKPSLRGKTENPQTK